MSRFTIKIDSAIAAEYDKIRDDVNRMALESIGVPRKLKCASCQLGDHCNGEDDGCWCECSDGAIRG